MLSELFSLLAHVRPYVCVQSVFLTERDGWAGDLSELLTETSPRTDTPTHFPDAHAPQKPFLPPFPIPGTPPPPPPSNWWRAFGPPYCNASNATVTAAAAGSFSDRGDAVESGAAAAMPPSSLACAPLIEGNLCDEHDHMIGAAGKTTHTIAECFAWCNATTSCQLFGFGSTGWCIRYAGECTPRQSPDPRYNVYKMTHRIGVAAAIETTEARRRLLGRSTGTPQHCSTREPPPRADTSAGSDIMGSDRVHHCPTLTGGGPNNKQRNQMVVLGTLTGRGLPDSETLDGMDQAAASAWIEQQWVSYMSGGHG